MNINWETHHCLLKVGTRLLVLNWRRQRVDSEGQSAHYSPKSVMGELYAQVHDPEHGRTLAISNVNLRNIFVEPQYQWRRESFWRSEA